MIDQLVRLQNLGIHDAMPVETAKRVWLVNSMSLLVLAMVPVIYGYFMIAVDAHPFLQLVLLLSLPTGLLPLIFNSIGLTLVSRMYFLLSSYFIIMCLPILVGPSLHFQYFLIGGIGIPLIFLGSEIGRWKYFVSLIAIPLWLYLELHFQLYQPILKIDPEFIFPIRMINDLLIFITVFLLVYLFITQSDKHLLELNRKSRRLEIRNSQLEQFAFIASHDLQEPLRTVTSFSGLLANTHANELDSDGVKYLRYVTEASQRMTKLVNGLLDYSRLGKSGDMKEVDLNQMVQEIIRDFDASLKDACAHIEVSDLPTIRGFEVELRMLFQNLISNSLKFRRPESPTAIEISVSKEGGHWRFAVNDNGIGIDQKNHRKVFEIFKRLHKQSEYSGTGIGLAHCKKIVELHNGNIWLDSTLGMGCTVFFTLNPGTPR